MSNMEINQVLAQMRAMAPSVKSAESGAEVNTANKADFGNLLKQSIDQVNETQMKASELTSAFAAGAPDVDLPEVMVSLQKANVSFQAVSQVRNRLLSAYQEVMSMQV